MAVDKFRIHFLYLSEKRLSLKACIFGSKQMAFVYLADRVADDKGLKESLGRYAIESGAIMEQVYCKKMEVPIEDMKRFLDGILHIHDEEIGRASCRERVFYSV